MQVKSASWKILSTDMTSKTAKVAFNVSLKKYSDDTAVTICLNGKDVPLTMEYAGVYSGNAELRLFDDYSDSLIVISENGESVTEEMEYVGQLFWDIMPIPSYSCSFSSKALSGGKLRYEGEYAVMTSNKDDIQSVRITYLTGGKELKTMDITEETLKSKTIQLEKGLKLESDLSFRLEITTKSGYKIVDESVMIYGAADYDPDETESLFITDMNGSKVWERTPKN